MQIKLYAALYHETFGLWPTHVELVLEQGEAPTTVVNEGECEELLQAAKRKRFEANNRNQGGIIEGTEEELHRWRVNPRRIADSVFGVPVAMHTVKIEPDCRDFGLAS